MNVKRASSLLLLLAFGLGAVPHAFGLGTGNTSDDKTLPKTSPPVPPTIYPQIVRVSYVQGDVRVSRGREAEKQTHEAWGKAEVNLPLESGFSLVTGDGRAEVEFENASVLYLAENSVLLFNALTSTGGVPHTEISLLSGTMTLNILPMAGEWFSVKTPTDGFNVHPGEKVFVRVESYLDAMSLTGMNRTVIHLDRTAAVHTQPNQTVSFKGGQKAFLDNSADPAAFAAWDAWVAGRVAQHDAATAQLMKDAGLSAPIPGLAGMAAQGRFFSCAPYGTCWEPNDGWAAAPLQPQTPTVEAMPMQAVSPRTVALNQAQNPAQSQPGNQGAFVPGTLTEEDEDFPCTPIRFHNWYGIDPVTGKRKLIRSESDWAFPSAYARFQAYPTLFHPYDWAVCHAGTWVYGRRHYVWVAGVKRHHHHPVHWVKTGRALGFVPIHPRDVKGETPLNLKNGIFHPIDKKGEGVEKLAYQASDAVKLLDDAPREFRRESYLRLAPAEAPQLVAHTFQDRSRPAGELAKAPGTPILFNQKSQSFMVAHPVVAGGSTRMVAEPIGGSTLQMHAPNSAEMARGGSYASASSSASHSSSGGYAGAAPSSSGSAASHSASAPAASAPAASAPAVSAPAPSFSSGGGGAASASAGSKSH